MANQYETVSEALYWMVANQQFQPGLNELSEQVGLSEAHLHRTFQDFAGVTPKQFMKFLTKQQALERLRNGRTVLDTALECGLSGPGRLHDLMVTTEAMTPGEARRKGAEVDMSYGHGPTPFGPALVSWTERGITFLGFSHEKSPAAVLEELRAQWPACRFNYSRNKAVALLERIFGNATSRPLKVWLRGSPFQLKVWEALLAIPPTAHCTYGQIAQHLAKPRASRAVGTALGRNPVAWLIPCHRVITSLGLPGGYRWGIDTKLAMIGFEAARGFRPRAAA